MHAPCNPVYRLNRKLLTATAAGTALALAGLTGAPAPAIAAGDGGPTLLAQEGGVTPKPKHEGDSPASEPKSNDVHLGLGAMIGSTNGLNCKVDLGMVGIACGLSFALGESPAPNAVYLQGDVVYQAPIVDNADILARLYGGVGAYGWVGDIGDFQIRIPVGAEFIPGDVPTELFAEIVPTLDVDPLIRLNLQGFTGVRYRF